MIIIIEAVVNDFKDISKGPKKVGIQFTEDKDDDSVICLEIDNKIYQVPGFELLRAVKAIGFDE